MVPLDSINIENFTLQEYIEAVQETLDEHVLSPVVENIVTSAYAIVLTIGLMSNLVICYLFAKLPKLRTGRNIYIANLAFSDILLCLFCVPFTLVRLLLKEWPLGNVLCKLIPWLQGFVVLGSTLSIAAIAINRYTTLLQYKIVKNISTDTSCTLVIAIIWLISALTALPLLIYTKLETIVYIEEIISYDICLEVWPSAWFRFIYAFAIMTIQFIIPLAILATLHWKMCTFLKYRIATNPRSLTELCRAAKDARRHTKNTTMFMAITFMFALCWFPLTSLNLIADFNHNIFMQQNFLLVFIIAHLLSMFSAIVNPIVYGWFNVNFRREFIDTVCFWKRFKIHKEKDLLPEGQIVFNRPVHIKAVQTEVQPLTKTVFCQTGGSPYGTIPYQVN